GARPGPLGTNPRHLAALRLRKRQCGVIAPIQSARMLARLHSGSIAGSAYRSEQSRQAFSVPAHRGCPKPGIFFRRQSDNRRLVGCLPILELATTETRRKETREGLILSGNGS